jgi:hypothetical protein
MMEMPLRQHDRRLKDVYTKASFGGVGDECNLREAKAGAQRAANQVLQKLAIPFPPVSTLGVQTQSTHTTMVRMQCRPSRRNQRCQVSQSDRPRTRLFQLKLQSNEA